MKKILILTFSNLNHDARVTRQVEFLQSNYDLTLVCFDCQEFQRVTVHKIKPIKPSFLQKALGAFALLTKQYEWAYRIIYNQRKLIEGFANHNFAVIIANDIETLPLAFLLKRNAKILFDAHEYAPRHFEDKLVWRLLFKGFNLYFCKKLIPKADCMTTVSAGLASEYHKHFGVNPVLITNASYFYSVSPRGTNSEQIKIVHHGAANPSRRIELMIQMMDFLDARFSLDLILLSPSTANKKTKSYLGFLKSQIINNDRIRILPPVKSSEIISTILNYDIGLFLLPPLNFNYQNALPNKLFDFIQARLAIAIGPTPEMARIVNEYDIGVVADDFTPLNLANKINALNEQQIDRFKSNANKAASELSADSNKRILGELMGQLIN